ncbi:MAG: TIGR00366 family protein [Oscillospiraceae bacterium]|nr:TIGR00366 family protein [Oscillospiraceae bacterium]
MKQKATKRSITDRFVDGCYRWMPNSLVLVFLLTILVAVLAVIFCGSPLITSTETKKSLVDAWNGGFWNLLTFAMQMSLVMLTGFILASAPVVKRGLTKLASIPNTTAGAMLLCGVATIIIWWVHWGLGMMGSIVLGRLCAAQGKKKGYKLDVPWLVAYLWGVECAGVGISQAAPLYGATPGYLQGLVVSDAVRALIPDTIPLADTVVNPLIIGQNIILFLVIVFVAYFIRPKRAERILEVSDTFTEEIMQVEVIEKPDRSSPAAWINSSPLLNIIIGGFGLIWSVRLLATTGIVGISLNNFNFIMLMLCVLLCWTPNVFGKSCLDAIGNIWGVVIQFPFYAGIFGLITLTGLNEVIVNFFTSISNHDTFPLVAYVYSGLLNLVVPSGGSKFIIEAPYIMEVCTRLDISIARIIDVYNFADLNTNIIQPFWGLAFLAMFRVDFKQIIPYTAIIALAVFVFNMCYIGILY